MKELEDRIRKEGRVIGDSILKVDSFLNHQVDPVLMDHIGAEFADLFHGVTITKVLTLEASGIAPALAAAYHLGVPLIFAKKSGSHNIGSDVYTSVVHSFTYNRDYTVQVSRAYLASDDRVLIVDDFLANGAAIRGMMELIAKAGASCAGVGVVVEKAFQDGGQQLRSSGVRVESLARIASMKDGEIQFVSEENTGN